MQLSEGSVTWQNQNDVSNFASKFQISVKFHTNFIFSGPFVFQISWQISYKSCSFNTLIMFFKGSQKKEERTGSMRLVNLNIHAENQYTRKYTASTRK